jgi:hypothetical protein
MALAAYDVIRALRGGFRLVSPSRHQSSNFIGNPGGILIRACMPRLFVLTIAAIIALSWVQVASVPTAPSPYRPRTVGAALDQVGSDLRATVTGLRQEILAQEATYTKLWKDTEYLKERLGTPPPQH